MKKLTFLGVEPSGRLKFQCSCGQKWYFEKLERWTCDKCKEGLYKGAMIDAINDAASKARAYDIYMAEKKEMKNEKMI